MRYHRLFPIYLSPWENHSTLMKLFHNSLSSNLTKWSNCFSVFDYFVRLALKTLKETVELLKKNVHTLKNRAALDKIRSQRGPDQDVPIWHSQRDVLGTYSGHFNHNPWNVFLWKFFYFSLFQLCIRHCTTKIS